LDSTNDVVAKMFRPQNPNLKSGLERTLSNRMAAQRMHPTSNRCMLFLHGRSKRAGKTIQAYQQHAGVLLGYAHQLTRDHALAQDAVQETFLRFFLALMQAEEIQNAQAWLHQVAHNYVCDTLRSATVRTAVPLEDAGEDRLRDERGVPGEDQASDWAETSATSAPT
jgi:DNA-directed RNA polymerase specialized sigma24 family protein